MTSKSHTKTVLKLVAVVAGMGAMGWAAVPLYDLFCRVTEFFLAIGTLDDFAIGSLFQEPVHAANLGVTTA